MFSFENTLREQKFRYLKMTFHYTKLIFLTEPYTPKSKMGKHDQNFLKIKTHFYALPIPPWQISPRPRNLRSSGRTPEPHGFGRAGAG